MKTPTMHLPVTVQKAKDTGLSTATYTATYDADVAAKAWYDPMQRMWVIYAVDSDGYQCDESTQAVDRQDAFLDLDWHVEQRLAVLRRQATLAHLDDQAAAWPTFDEQVDRYWANTVKEQA